LGCLHGHLQRGSVIVIMRVESLAGSMAGLKAGVVQQPLTDRQTDDRVGAGGADD